MKRKIISGILAGLMVMSVFSGCGSSPSNSSISASTSTDTAEAESSGDSTTISFWCNFTGSDGDVLREIVDNYNKTNTDNITVEIDIMDYATLQSKLPTAISTGTGPSFIFGTPFEPDPANCLNQTVNRVCTFKGKTLVIYYPIVVSHIAMLLAIRSRALPVVSL